MGVLRLRAWIFIGSFAASAGPARAQTSTTPSTSTNKQFFDTTTGDIYEDTTNFNGVSQQEDQQLDQQAQKIMTRFRKGRQSSAINGRSRYAGILEMHDEDFDGVTDHDLPGGGNALESGTEMAATGKSGGAGDSRQKDLAQAEGTAGRCVADKSGSGANAVTTYIIQGSKTKNNPDGITCKNISANIVDMGPAHGAGNAPVTHKPLDPETEDHRIYDLSVKAFQASISAGSQYAQAVGQAASDYGTDVSSAGAGAKAITNSDGTVSSVQIQSVDKNGNSTNETVGVAANIDMLRSEYSWLEQQKQHEIDLEWQSLRAARLAGADQNPGSALEKSALKEFSNILGTSGISDSQKMQQVAQRVEERQLAGSDYYTNGPNGKPTCGQYQTNPKAQGNGGGLPCLDNTGNPRDYETVAEYSSVPGTSEAQSQQAYQTALGKMDPKKKQQMAQDESKIQNCMQQNVWCYGPNQTQNAPQKLLTSNKNNTSAVASDGALYQPVQGDPGNAFNDDREYVYNRLSIANKGPITDFMKTMTSADFNIGTDAKTNNHPFAAMAAQAQAVQDAAKSVQQAEQQKENGNYGQDSTVDPAAVAGYKTPYTTNKFDPKTMNTVKLFGRDPTRDGVTLDTSPIVTSQAPSSATGGGQDPTAESTAPAASAPTPVSAPAPASITAPTPPASYAPTAY